MKPEPDYESSLLAGEQAERDGTQGKPEPRTEFVTWDWKDQPDPEAIARAVENVSGGRTRVVAFDTGGDQFGWAISSDPALTKDEAESRWDALNAEEALADEAEDGD
jgi:hypothetical protein